MKNNSTEKLFTIQSTWASNVLESSTKENVSFSMECKKLVSSFVNTTTVPGLVQVCRSKSLMAKMMWCAMLLIGFLITVQQSYDLMNQYLKYDVIERVVRDIAVNPPLPAVTICANSLLNMNAPGNLSKLVWERALQHASIKNRTLDLFVSHAIEREILKQIFTLSVEERIQIGYSYDDLVWRCISGGHLCHGSIITTYSLVYGNCYTMNSFFENLTNETNDFNGEITVYLQAPWNIYTNKTPGYGPAIFIHESKTAPPLQQEHAYLTFPQKWTTMKMQRVVINRLKSPYTSHCVDHDDHRAIKESYYYSESTPYEYTYEACVKTCLQRETMRLCKCTMKSVPLPQNSTMRNKDCNRASDMCIEVDRMAAQLCKCPLRCQETKYHIDVEQDDRWFEYGNGKEFIEGVVMRRRKGKPNLLLSCGFNAILTASFFETITEEAAITWTTVFGSIGGSLGLWIGLSIMSLGELVDFAIKLMSITIKHVKNRYTNT